MPLFGKKKTDPEVEAAQAEAQAALPNGWKLKYFDFEMYRHPRGSLETYGVAAVGPAGEAAFVAGLGEAEVYRDLARYARGELPIADGWAPPVTCVRDPRDVGGFSPRSPHDREVRSARADVEAALPPGWALATSDYETYRFPGGSLQAYGVSALGPGGEVALAIALGEANALRALLRRVQGELTTETAWAPPVQRGL